MTTIHNPSPELVIAGKSIGPKHPTYFIADIAAEFVKRFVAMVAPVVGGAAVSALMILDFGEEPGDLLFAGFAGQQPGRFAVHADVFATLMVTGQDVP